MLCWPGCLTYLLLLGEEEPVWVDTIRDSAAENGEVVEHNGWLIRVLEEELVQDIENDCEDEKGGESGGDNNGKRRVGSKIAQWAGDSSEDTHLARSGRMRD